MGILDKFILSNKVAVVTGGNRGLGKAMARALGEAGAHVVIAGRSRNSLEETAEELRQHRIEVLALQVDVGKEEDLDRLVNRTLETFKRIDILVNNAGISYRQPAEKISLENWDHVYKINLRSVFLLSQKVGKFMIKQRSGKIVNVGSLLSEQAVPEAIADSTTKAGIKMLTQSLALEWAQYNIQVNAIGPGYFRTDMMEPLYQNPAQHSMVINRLSIKRWGKPEDLQGAIIFLASAASDYMTGQVLYIDGGWLAG